MDIEKLTRPVLDAAGFRGDVKLRPLTGGANNRAFHVHSEEREAFLKIYFHHPGDKRDRLGTEYAFVNFAWRRGLSWVARPFAKDPANHVGLYEFIPGTAVDPSWVDEDAVSQAVQFFLDLNKNKDVAEAQLLPDGSEACFSLAEHWATVERRLKRLDRIEEKDALHRDARTLTRRLASAWKRISKEAEEKAASFDKNRVLSSDERCISPSDFGFHNALALPGGSFRFIDFEYAGWDDPAKMVCDFFCQPKIPVSMVYYDSVVKRIAKNEREAQRCAVLLPVYRTKWACILLNDFLPVSGTRREFSAAQTGREERLKRQLEKTEKALETL